MRGILIRIGRFKSLENYYTKVHLRPIKKLWEDFELRQQSIKLANEKNEVEQLSRSVDSQSNMPTLSFARWLPNFYDELLLYLEQEWKWYDLFRFAYWFLLSYLSLCYCKLEVCYCV